MEKKLYHSPFNIAVLAAGLGFFIDAFDLFLFNVYRIPSLKELGLSGEELTRQGEFLLSIQMLGMMIGGVLSGVIADKKGRVTVLFGSILLYSVANILITRHQPILTNGIALIQIRLSSTTQVSFVLITE